MPDLDVVDTTLTRTLKSFSVPVQRLRYDGKAETFITFQLVYAPDVQYADDEYGTEEYRYRADVYAKSDYIALVRDIKRALREAGFYGISAGPELYESETGYNHMPIEMKFTEGS